MLHFRFCPQCGEPLSRNAHARDPQTCSRCGHMHYHNSKPCVGAIVVEDDRVLLVKRSVAPFKGWWDIPGGFLEAGEHPVDGVIREVWEETGLEVRPIGILDIFVDRYGASGDYTLNIYYLAEPVSGEAKPASDAEALRWFPRDQLPARIAFANGRAALAAWRQASG